MIELQEERSRYFLYRWIRLDKNEPFYIGKGTVNLKKRGRKRYWRAYVKNGRSKFFKNIIKKTKYKVQIFFESDDLDLTLRKEAEFIRLYGRKNLDEGILVNLSDGGEKGGKQILTPEIRLRMSEVQKDRLKNGFPPNNRKTTFVYDKQGSFIRKYDSVLDASKDLDLPYIPASLCNCGKRDSVNQYVLYPEYKGEKINPYKRNTGNNIGVKVVTEIGDILSFTSIREAYEAMGEVQKAADRSLSKNVKTRKGNLYIKI